MHSFESERSSQISIIDQLHHWPFFFNVHVCLYIIIIIIIIWISVANKSIQ